MIMKRGSNYTNTLASSLNRIEERSGRNIGIDDLLGIAAINHMYYQDVPKGILLKEFSPAQVAQGLDDLFVRTDEDFQNSYKQTRIITMMINLATKKNGLTTTELRAQARELIGEYVNEDLSKLVIVGDTLRKYHGSDKHFTHPLTTHYGSRILTRVAQQEPARVGEYITQLCELNTLAIKLQKQRVKTGMESIVAHRDARTQYLAQVEALRRSMAYEA